jgi:pimeloyl-ACP methyl ester carboxylesterase
VTPEQIIAFVAALTIAEPDPSAFAAIRAGGADPRYPVTVAACPRPLAPFEIEGRTVLCGRVAVPEDHARPEGRRLDLSFMVFGSRSVAPAADAVVHLHGGPGSGIVERASLTSTFFDKLRARRDIVAFDQRGVDTSGGGTRCVETVAGNVEAMAGVLRGQNNIPHLQADLMRACIAEVTRGGLDIANINTQQNARDVQAVMRALGYPAYNIYGISYGTKLGLEVMREAPEGLRAVVLDSVAPPHVPVYDTLALPHAEAFQSIFDQCAAVPACDAAYPNLRARFWALFERLTDTPLQTSEGPLSSEVLFAVIDGRNGHQTAIRGLTAQLPRIIAELERGETTTLRAAVGNRLPGRQTAESVAAGLAGLPPATAATARIALTLARQQAETDIAVRLALLRLEEDRAAAQAGLLVAEGFEAALAQAVRGIAAQPARVAFARDYLLLRARPPAAEPLLALIARHLSATERPRLEALVRAMSPGDVAEVFRRMGADNTEIAGVLLSAFQLGMYACQEDMAINSIEGARRLNATLGWPRRLTDQFEQAIAGFYESCAAFRPRTRPGWHDPVTSPVPALVFSGLSDTQTAASWGPETARHLPNGRAVVFPETGHGALAFSACAQDLGVAFIENPSAPLDTGCVAALRPRFVLPDGSEAR